MPLKTLPKSTGNPPALTVAGWKIYYADGTALSSRDVTWEKAPTAGVLLVLVFFRETYPIWIGDKQETHNYRAEFQGEDYYWKIGDEFFAGSAADVPRLRDLPMRVLSTHAKEGCEVAAEQFWRVTAIAEDDRIF